MTPILNRDIDKRSLSERDICTNFITPAVRRAGWDVMSQIREEVSFTKGRIIVRGKLVSRGKAKRAKMASSHPWEMLKPTEAAHMRQSYNFSKNDLPYEIDVNYCDWFGMNVTWNVNGYLRRVSKNQSR
jgi:hypothetical protein